MSLNGSGVFNVNSTGQPVVASTLISASVFNAFTADVASALSTALFKDGQQAATGNQPMGGFRHTGVGDALLRTQYLALGQLQDGSGAYGTVTGTDTIVLTLTPGIPAYAAGQVFRFVAAGANTGAATLNVSTLGAKAITKNGATALAAGDIPSGAVVEVIYDGTQFQLVGNPGTFQAYDADIPTVAASQAEMEAGTEVALRSMSPLRVAQAVAAQTAAQVSEGYIYIRDEKTTGTAGGGFTAGAWRTRTLNTEVNDAGGHASLGSNQITLAAGTYRFIASAPAYYTNGHQAKLINTTDAIEYLGTSEYSVQIAPGFATTRSFVSGRFTIAGSKVFELQHRCQTTNSTDGLGLASSSGSTEVYAQVEFWKEV